MTDELHPIGCARLVQAVVVEACWPRYRDTNGPPGNHQYGGFVLNAMPNEIRTRATRLLELSDSPLVEHLAAVFEWDLERVQAAMARRASEWWNTADKMEGVIENA